MIHRWRHCRHIVPLAFLAACAVRVPERTLPPVSGIRTLEPPEEDRTIRVHHRSGELTVLTSWVLDSARSLIGAGTLYDLRREPVRTGAMHIPADSVALIEATTMRTLHALGPALMNTWMVLYGAVTVSCMIDPKSCFGSCPTFYLDDVNRDRPRAEGFSSSIARALEATDVDDLGEIRPAGARIDVRMANEAWETHAVRSVRLLAVPVTRGETVVADGRGAFRTVRSPRPATTCQSSTGDCRAPLAVRDDLEWRSVTDEHDLAASDTIMLAFAPHPGPLGLVLGARQTFVSTYVLYQTMAYLGREAGAWLASLERGDPAAHGPLAQVNRMIGEIDIAVAGPSGEWRHVGTYAEAGPIASDVQLTQLGDVSGSDSVRVRLTFAKGAWRLGYAALATIGDPVRAVALDPERARSAAGVDVRATLTDSAAYLMSQPGDEFLLSFTLPRETSAYAIFLESRGWYYEWMRGEWYAEQNPVMAGVLMLNPRDAMRRMAPGFKAREDTYERSFWNSRFGRK